MDSFITFQKFNNLELANEYANVLRTADIPCLVENNHVVFNPNFTFSELQTDISLKLRQSDFNRANQVIEDLFAESINKVDPDYYLYQFSDLELMEILIKPDEWGHFDILLAKKILADRGKPISTGVVGILKEQRLQDLTHPGRASKYLLYTGYVSAIFGGLFGLIIGSTLAYFKRTLPDGSKVYAFTSYDRDHGTRILIISAITLFVIFCLKIWATFL